MRRMIVDLDCRCYFFVIHLKVKKARPMWIVRGSFVFVKHIDFFVYLNKAQYIIIMS